MTLHSALAEAVVLVRADGSHLSNDIGTHAEKAGAVAGQRMGRSLTSSFRRLVGSALVLEAVKSAVQYADAFEKSRSRLETITKNIGANFNDLGGQVDALDQHMAALGFTNADVEGSIASLETATKDPTKALKDMALAADIARGRNIGLEEATRILMRVETGHVAMLSKLGIQTKDANGHLLTQKEALVALATVYGGSATHYAGTFAGKQEALSAQLKNSAAQIGVSLLPAVVSLAGVLQKDVVPIVVNTTHWFERNQSTLKPLTEVILGVVAAWKVYTLWTKAAAAATLLFGRSTGGAAAGAAAEGVAVRMAAGGAVGGAATAATASEGAVIGGGMAAKLSTANVGLANSSLLAAKNVGFMGLAALGFANFISNPRSLGFPMGFNKDRFGSDKVLPYDPKIPSSASAPPGTKVSSVAGIEYVPQAKAVNAAADAHAANAVSTLDDVNAQKQAIISSRGLVIAQIASSRAQARAARQARDAAQAEKEFAHNVRSLTSALETHAAKVLATSGSYDAFRQLLNDLPGVVKQNGHALQGYSDKAIANRQALSDAAQAIFTHIDAMKAQHKNAKVVEAALISMEGRLRRQAAATYGSRDAVDAFLRKLHLLPAQTRSALARLGADGTKIGSQLGAGLVAGMQAKEHAVTTEAKIIADQAVKGMRLSIKPGSPSKVTTKLGQQAGDGLVVGMKDRQAAVGKQAKALADTMVTNYKDTFSAARDSISAYADVSGVAASGVGYFAYQQAKANDLKQFVRVYMQLEHRGLDEHLLGEFEAAGPAAIGAMQQILQAKNGVRRANRLDTLDQRLAGRVAGVTADDQLARAISALPHSLAEAVARVLRKELNINIDVHDGGATVHRRRRAR